MGNTPEAAGVRNLQAAKETHMGFDKLRTDISGAALRGYIVDVNVTTDWVSYRHPAYPWDSSSLQGQRFNPSGQAAFYLASGDFCGQMEVLDHCHRIKCNITPCNVQAFDLARFARDYGYGDAFVQQRASGGWSICQEVSNLLTENFSVSGIVYQSAAMHTAGEVGYCMAIIPGRERNLPSGFFAPAAESSGGVP
jgi:hypothetical protein